MRIVPLKNALYFRQKSFFLKLPRGPLLIDRRRQFILPDEQPVPHSARSGGGWVTLTVQVSHQNDDTDVIMYLFRYLGTLCTHSQIIYKPAKNEC